MIRGEISLLGTTVKTLNHLSGIDYVIELLNEVIVSEWQDNEIKEFKIGVVKKKLATQIYTYMYNERNSESFELDDKDARLLIEYADECFSEIKEKEGMEIKSTDLYNNPFSKHSIIMLGSMGLMVKCKSSEFPAKTARIYCDQIFKDLDELSKKLNDSNEQFIKETIVLEKVKWHFLLQQDEEGGRVLKEYKFEFHELRYRKAVLLSRFSLFDDAVKECEELIKLLDGGNASIKNAKYLNKKTEIFLAITKWDQYESEGGLNTELLVQAFLKLTKILRADTTGTNYITIIGHLKHVAESMKKADMDFSSYINFFPSPHNQYTNWIDLCRGLNIEHKDKEDTISKDNIVKMLKLRPDRKPCKIKSYCEIK